MKTCTKCHDQKTFDQFNKNSSKTDGLHNMCRNCMNSYKKEYNKTPSGKLVNEINRKKYFSSEKGKANKKRYKASAGGRALIKANQRKNEIKHLNAHNCRNRTKYLIRKGELIRPTSCDDCDISCKPQGHHSDYNYPRDIQWLCQSCHMDWHNNNIPLNRAIGFFTEKNY